MKYQAAHHSGGSRYFENWGGGGNPERGAYPSKIAKISGIFGLKSRVLLKLDGKFQAKRGGGDGSPS
jgi:hypothetical protein